LLPHLVVSQPTSTGTSPADCGLL